MPDPTLLSRTRQEMRFDEDQDTLGLTEKDIKELNYPSINLRAIVAINLKMGNNFLRVA